MTIIKIIQINRIREGGSRRALRPKHAGPRRHYCTGPPLRAACALCPIAPRGLSLVGRWTRGPPCSLRVVLRGALHADKLCTSLIYTATWSCAFF